MRLPAFIFAASLLVSACAQQTYEPISAQTYTTGKGGDVVATGSAAGVGTGANTVASQNRTVPGCDGRANSIYRGNLYCLTYR